MLGSGDLDHGMEAKAQVEPLGLHPIYVPLGRLLNLSVLCQTQRQQCKCGVVPVGIKSRNMQRAWLILGT